MCVCACALLNNRLFYKYLLKAYCVNIHSMDNTKMFEKHPVVSQTLQPMLYQEF